MKRNFIKYIKLKNFKNFANLEVDFTSALDSNYPSLIFVYGGNGVGKTNIFSLLSFLKESIRLPSQKNARPYYREIRFDIDDSETFEYGDAGEDGIKPLIKKYKRFGSENLKMDISIGFDFMGDEYFYHIVTDDCSVIYENLAIRENVRITNIFLIDKGNEIYLSAKHLPFNELRMQLINDIKLMFGRNSFLALLYDYYRKMNYNNISKTISSQLVHVFQALSNFDIINEMSFNYRMPFKSRKILLPSLLQGIITNDEHADSKFKNTIDLLMVFYKKYIPNIEHLEYKKIYVQDSIKYFLVFKKRNAEGKLIEIPYKDESYGTIALTRLIVSFLKVLLGQVVILDDLYLGLHDAILSHIFLDFSKIEKIIDGTMLGHGGQLFVIAQNTVYFSNDLRDNIYLLNNELGQAPTSTFEPLSFYNRAYQPKSNFRNVYLKGKKGDASFSAYDENADLDKIIEILDR